MSNYAHGNIRLRGKRENILNFLREELCSMYQEIDNPMSTENWVTREDRPVHIVEHAGGYMNTVFRDPDTEPWFYFRNVDTNGQFIMKGEESFELEWLDGPNKRDDQVVAIDDFEARYEQVETEYFCRMAMKYKIDIRIFLLDYESGYSGVDTFTFYRNGKKTFTSQIYKDRLWEAPVYYWA